MEIPIVHIMEGVCTYCKEYGVVLPNTFCISNTECVAEFKHNEFDQIIGFVMENWVFSLKSGCPFEVRTTIIGCGYLKFAVCEPNPRNERFERQLRGFLYPFPSFEIKDISGAHDRRIAATINDNGFWIQLSETEAMEQRDAAQGIETALGTEFANRASKLLDRFSLYGNFGLRYYDRFL